MHYTQEDVDSNDTHKKVTRKTRQIKIVAIKRGATSI